MQAKQTREQRKQEENTTATPMLNSAWAYSHKVICPM